MSIEQSREESTELAIQRMEWEGASVPTAVDDLARKTLSAPTAAKLMGKQARRIFDGVIDQVTHRPPAARQKPR